MKYEYKVETIIIGRGIFSSDDDLKQQRQLNAAGEQGWKLVCIGHGVDYMKYIYIREKP